MSNISTVTSPSSCSSRRKTNVTTSAHSTNSQTNRVANPLNVVVKHRFKHSRSALTNGSPCKRQKTGLQQLSESYQDDTNSDSSTTTSPSTQDNSTSITNTPQQSTTVQTPIPTTTAQKICQSCKSTETLEAGSGSYKCLKCHRTYLSYASLTLSSAASSSSGGSTVGITTILPAAKFYTAKNVVSGNPNLLTSNRTPGAPMKVGGPQLNNPSVIVPQLKNIALRHSTKKLCNSGTKKNEQETIDLISSDEEEEEDDEEDAGAREAAETTKDTQLTANQIKENLSKESQGISTTTTAITASTSTTTQRIADRMKLPGGESVNRQQQQSEATYTSNNTTTTSTTTTNYQSTPTPEQPYIFKCNKVMFGELYGHAVAPTRVTNNRMFLTLECNIIRENVQVSEKYTLSVGSSDVENIFIYFGRIPSFVAIETAKKFASVACKRIGRDVLCPTSENIKQRYIILALNSAFQNDLEAEIERKNLVTAVAPWANVRVISHNEATRLISQVNLEVFQKEVVHNITMKGFGSVETLLIYPPSLKSGGIPITTLDVSCLDEGTYLNDIIIDFYLKYLWESIMTKEQREKTYIFNSYFYKRLTKKPTTKPSPAAMHAQVKKWTRNVDIFHKDFIIIPVNEHSHWYLVIICFPTNPTNVEIDSSEKEEEEDEEEDTPDFIMKEGGNTPDISEAPELSTTPPPTLDVTPTATIPVTTEVTVKETEEKNKQTPQHQDDSTVESDKKSEDEVTQNTKNTESSGTGNADTIISNEITMERNERNSTTPKEPPPTFKQATDIEEFSRPCILIFDSLVGSGHSKVFTNLRHYLTEEWASRKPDKGPIIFDKDTMKGSYPKIPRQNNDCDCGVFLLQYAEYFFTKPINNFRFPIHLESWFTIESVTKKRDEIITLINELSYTHRTATAAKTSKSKPKKK